jgi:hypothetical protein
MCVHVRTLSNYFKILRLKRFYIDLHSVDVGITHGYIEFNFKIVNIFAQGLFL